MTLKYLLILFLTIFIYCSCKETNEQLIDKAIKLRKEKRYEEAIRIYSYIIKKNSRLQLPYYNRGYCYLDLKQYDKAFVDFNKVMSLHQVGNFIFSYNSDSPFADEETRAQISYNDALYMRAQVKFYMDSIESSYRDFKMLISVNYEKSNCLLWQGTLWFKSGDSTQACKYFKMAKEAALNNEDIEEANRLIKGYCN